MRTFLSDSYVDSLLSEPVEEENNDQAQPVVDDEQEATTPVEEQAEDVQTSGLEPDDASIALLENNGTDLLQYLIGEGVTSEEEMAIAINEWGQKNSKTIPIDKSVLIYALKPHVLEQ